MGKKGVFINGTAIPGKLSLHKKNEFLFDLPGNRHAAISVKPQFASAPAIELRVDGQLMVPTEKKPALCSACGTVVKPNDRFCGNCGQARPPAENYLHHRHLKEATTAIWTLAVLFCLFGIVMFFVTRSQASDALAKLDGMSPDAILPNAINGVRYTVAALRDQINWEPWSVLIVNLLLATVMAGLAVWGMRAPLAAVLVASATYAVVMVTNAIVDPASIGQGIAMKIIIILFLFRGIKGALALRTANA